MASPPPSLQFGALKRRSFSFYPPILNVEHNQWRLRQMAGPELLVTNLKSDLEVWVPKRLIGRIEDAEDPALTVCLLRELEYKAGSLRQSSRRVVELPLSQTGGATAPGKGLARFPGHRRSQSRWMAAAAGALLLGLCVFAAVWWLGGRRRSGDLLSLTAHDDYSSVVRTLGPPASEDLRSRPGEPVYRAMWYPKRSCYVILYGSSPGNGRYIGTLDRDWRVIRHVTLAGGRDSAPILTRLPRF